MDIQVVYDHFMQCSSACTDTRKIEQGCMFFALKGENFDGNTFAKQALDEGAKYCVIDNPDLQNENFLLVDNVLNTLQQLATHHRNQLLIPVIALTGSNGKTTTKELINAVLSKKFNTTATLENLNNHIGVPLTLLRMNDKTDIAIIEMGANHPKEIEFLCKIAQPDYGLITNFGKAHLEGFGSIEGVIRSKSELYDYLKEHQKTIFVNENDKTQVKQTLKYGNVYHFGLITSVDTRVELLDSQPYVTLRYNGHNVKSQLTGTYNFNNMAVAIAVGSYFKVDPKDIISAIESYTPTNNRSQIIEKGSNIIIMDAYNANPTSMMAAIENFKQLDRTGKILFLGDMFELGETSEDEHQAIATFLENNPFERIYLIGENFFKTKASKNYIHKFQTFEDITSTLKKSPIDNKFILIKGSRGMAMERVLAIL